MTKRNPRPRKYASQAERQAAYRARNVMLEFRAEPKTADNITKIADTLGYPRSDVLLSMVKFALTNHDWARFGLTQKTIPTYKENPTMKPASPAQIAARKRFAEMARSGAFKKATKRKTNPLVISAEADKSLGYYGSRGHIRKLLEDYANTGRVVSVRKKRGSNAIGVAFSGGKEVTLEKAKIYLENLVNEGILKPSPVKPFRMSNPTYRPIIKAAMNIRELAYDLENISQDDKKQISDYTDAEILHEAKYVLDIYHESGTVSNDALMGEHGKDEQKSARDDVRKLKALIKKFGATTQRKTNPAKKTVSQKISQLVHEGYPQRQAVAVALSEQRAGKVKRNPAKTQDIYFVSIMNQDGLEYGVDRRTPVTYTFSAKEPKKAYRSFGLPFNVTSNPKFQEFAKRNKTIVASLNEIVEMMQGFAK